MSDLDVIELPGQPGKYGRRVLVRAWQAAGSPPVNSAGRLHALQKYFYDGWRAGLPGFNPADNPDDESQRLAHVRFAGLDIDPTPARITALSRAGLIRPYSYEPWHWELPNVRQYAIVRSIPASAGGSTEGKLIMDDADRSYIDGMGASVVAQVLAALPAGVWNHPVQAQDGAGKLITRPDGSPIRFPASGFLASTNAQVGGAPAEVDEAALARNLAPLLAASLTALSDADIARIADAVADEQAQRLAK